MSIAGEHRPIRAEIAEAAREAGRHREEITLVGASKMNDAAACREAIAAGIDALGENRVQEMLQKLAQHAYDGAPLHFIGHLQRNKVKQVVGKVALIQSVGSLELLEEIDKTAAQAGWCRTSCWRSTSAGGGQERLSPGDARRRRRRAQELPTSGCGD